ncbi:MAG: hypothetical protein VB118_05715 [Oscillospiraceae bacterium]|nr:hypothetical protein [Oscillospiraceae bacterium]
MKKLKQYSISLLVMLIINLISYYFPFILTSSYTQISTLIGGNRDATNIMGINIISSFAFCIILSVIYIFFEKNKLSEDSADGISKESIKNYAITNAISYIIISLPVSIYFLILGVSNVYNNSLSELASQKFAGQYENGFLINFFSPQLAFFRLTRNFLAGFFLNLIIYLGITTLFIFYNKKASSNKNDGGSNKASKQKKPPREEKERDIEF